MKSKVFLVLSITAGVAAMTGCVSRGNNPGWEYAPDMYYSKGYEPYNQGDTNTVNPYGMTMREPVAGTIALGKLDYVFPFDNTAEGYEAAGKALDFPADLTDNDCRGKYMYEIYCSPCHGKSGKNDGSVMGKLGKPAWDGYQSDYIKNLEVGKIYHVLTYGKNNMGSHASVLTPADRWKVIKYVKMLSQGQTCAANGAVSNAPVQAAIVKGDKLADANEQKELETLVSAVNFGSGNAVLTAEAEASLTKLAALLIKHPEMTVSIEGHTDSKGNADQNLALSKARAASVANLLISKGVAKAKIASNGFGSTKSVASNDTEEGRAKNRRVEFILSKK